MRYYKILTDNRLTVIGVGDGGIEITETEYNEIKSIVDSRPVAPEGYGYRLTAELEWELYEVPATEEEDEELTDEQALEILLGGVV